MQKSLDYFMLISSEEKGSQIRPALYGAAHTDTISIFGPRAYEKCLARESSAKFRPTYGNFALVSREGATIRISTDHFGLFRIYLYRDGTRWALSDSFYSLVQYVKAKAWPITPYLPSVYSFFLPGGLGHQMVSFKTVAKEIELVPHWNDIIIDEQGISLTDESRQKCNSSVDDAIRDAGVFFGSLIKGYLSHEFRPYLTLSAGLDSRCTLAAILGGLPPSMWPAVGMFTHKGDKWKHEKDIVFELCQTYCLKCISERPCSRHPNWQEWKHCFLGTQSHFASYPRPLIPAPRLTGGSGELVKPFYEWRGSLEGICFPPYISKKWKNSILEDIEASVTLGRSVMPPELPVEMVHYQMFRNRFHFGRQISDSVFNIPILVDALLQNYNSGRKYSNLHKLILSLGGRELLEQPFDDISKAWDKAGEPASLKAGVEGRLEASSIQSRQVIFSPDEGGGYVDLASYANKPNDAYYPRYELYEGLLNEARCSIELVRECGIVEDWCVDQAERQFDLLKQNGAATNPNALRAILALVSLELLL